MVVNVVVPQLKNLTFRDCGGEYVISAPDLASLLYDGCEPSQISSEGFHSLEKADLCVSCLEDESDFHQIVCLLQQIRSVKFLALNSEFVEVISSSIEQISRKLSPFANLKRIKIQPECVSMLEQPNEKVTISTDVKNYFLDSSPSATFTMVSHKEIRALCNADSARNLMGELQVLLEQCKKDIDSNMTRLDLGKTPMESHNAKMHEQGNAQEKTEKQYNFGGRMTQFEKYWEDLNERMVRGKEKTSHIISMLREIEGLLTNLPPSQTANLQTRFSSMCAEADITMKKLTEFMKIQFD